MRKRNQNGLRAIADDDSGSVLSSELIVLGVIALVALVVPATALRDAVLSEISDVAGSVQDNKQSFVVNGTTTSSSSVAGMGFRDEFDILDDAEDESGLADNGIVMTVDAMAEGDGFTTLTSVIFGNATDFTAPWLDGWRSILVVDRSQTVTSTATDDISVVAETFSFHSGRSDGVVTPFIVKVLGFNDFEVVAVGDTVAVNSSGDQTHPFSASTTTFNMAPGETLAFGFTDANADGSSSQHSIVRFTNGGNPVYLTGGSGANQAGSVSVGSAPVPGASTFSTLNRTYQYSIGLGVPVE